ncbi:MAG TPA: class I adenylate-forming enzyme family protein [Acidimicrobiales bacterium]|jgi:acyl-CoA synthetase (AMP-forming)/AMP-acid ligase II|nr:class I adenylate-forming enzyme family protein [Acidimicrobiales bacterium]
MLAEVLRKAGQEFGERPAYISADGWPVTYQQLDQFSDEAAVWLSRHGVGVGTVVALVLPSTVDYIVLYGALAKVGAITAGVNPMLTGRERAAALECAAADLVIADPALVDGVPPDARLIEHVAGDHPDAIAAAVRARGEAPPVLLDDPERGVAICFTSGSTGMPKGALFREKQIRAIAWLDTGGGAGAGWGGGGHAVASTQFAHVGGMCKFSWLLAGGGTTHLQHRWRASTVLAWVQEYRMPALNVVAPQLAIMLRLPDFDSYDLSSVKAIVAGAAPSTPGLIREARERIGAPYSVRWSSTESGGVGTATALDGDDEETMYTVGKPRMGVEAMVGDEAGRPLPAGEIGELMIRSAGVMSEYWRNPEETARTLTGGWLRTGDLALVDDRGFFRLAGRLKEMFIRGGYNVYPLEVEKILSAHPKVADIALVPRPDDVMGEIGVAVVVPRRADDPPTLDDLRSFGASELAKYKLPERIRIVDDMPLNSGHKLDRRTLAAREREPANW